MKKFLIGVLMMFGAINAEAQDIKLVAPDTSGGIPVLDAIKARRAGRSMSDKMLSGKHLSTLLWSVWGYSSDDDRRVVPTAMNEQKMELYVVTPNGWYLYDAEENVLNQKGKKDLRPLIAQGQDYAKIAPVHLLFVTDDKKYGAMHAGSMYENAGLYCASEKLQCVVRAWIDQAGLKSEMALTGDKEVVITMAVGYSAQ
jgi:hypothetical protein